MVLRARCTSVRLHRDTQLGDDLLNLADRGRVLDQDHLRVGDDSEEADRIQHCVPRPDILAAFPL